MKRIKILILVLAVVLLSGCSVEYNLTINEDNSVNEKVVASEYTNRMKAMTGLNERQSVDYLYGMFDRQDIKTSIKRKKESNKTYATVTGSYKSLDKYVKNFKSDIVPKVIKTEKDNIVTLEFDQDKVLSSNTSSSLVYDDIVVNIILPYKVTKHNADSVNRNTYTWKIKKDAKKRKIKISYDKTDYKYKKEVKIGKVKFNIRYEVLIIGSFLLVIGLISLFVYINNKKNNRI